MQIAEMVKDICARSKKTGGIESVYFVACGGSWLAQYPARYLIERESKNLKVGHFTSNEFVHMPPKGLSPKSIVILCSLMGTPETEVASKVAKDTGAIVISFCGNADSPMSKIADYLVPFKSIFAPDTAYMESNAAPMLLLAFELLYQIEQYPHYHKALQGFEILQDLVEEAKKYFEPRAVEFAAKYKDEKLIYLLASGPAMGVGYGFSICSLMEMQWINAPLINTGEFFHGPFEIVDRTLPFVILMSEGRSRPLDMRALDFLKKYGERITVLDAKELFINRIDDSVSEYFNHFVLDVAQRRILDNLAEIRNHDKMTRRYMWKVKY